MKTAKPIRVAMHTFGCRSNFADSVELQAGLVSQGAHPCEIDEDADVYVVNTCTVTDSADKDLYKLIRRIERSKPGARIVVTGCMAEAHQEALQGNSSIEQVIGPGRREELLQAIMQSDVDPVVQNASLPILDVHAGGRRVKKSLPRRRSISLNDPMPASMNGPGELLGSLANRSRFHLRVQEGCENSCTFCIIPSTRGRLSSRSIDLILQDIEHLASVGYQEVVLTGTHLGGWGEDLGLELSTLLDSLGRFSAIRRIRLSSIDPNDLGDSSLDCLVKYDVFCHHLHICFQAFVEQTLKLMNRKYGLQEAVALIEKVATALPGCAIGSDVIAGFPGESREELEEGMELFLHLPISYLHVFPYSERSNTAAVRLPGSVEPGERKRRAARWRSLAARKRDSYMKGLLGRELEVICERVEDSQWSGTSREFATSSVAIAEGEAPRPGSCHRVRAKTYSVERGELECELLSQVS